MLFGLLTQASVAQERVPLRLTELQQRWNALVIAPVDDASLQRKALEGLLDKITSGPAAAVERRLHTVSRLRLLRPLAPGVDATVLPTLRSLTQRYWAQASTAAARQPLQETLSRLEEAPLFEFVSSEAIAPSVDLDAINAPTLVHFWARWCAPCLVELPELVQFHAGGAAGLRLVTVNHDPGGMASMRLPGIDTLEDPDFALYRRISGRSAVALPATYLLLPDSPPQVLAHGRVDWGSSAVQQHLQSVTRSTL